MTSPIIAVCLGDIHLDQGIWRKIRALVGDAELGYSSFIDQAIRLNVPVIILGDLFDSTKPDPALVTIHRKQMDRCKAANVPVYFIQGNHDKQTIPWPSALHEWPKHLLNMTAIGGITFKGFDYAGSDDIKAIIEDYITEPKQADVVLLHQAIRQALPFDGAWNLDLALLDGYAKLVLLGDLHKELDFEIGSLRAYYSGSGHARDIDQVGPKSCLAVHKDLSVSRIPIKYRAMRKFIINDKEGFKLVEDWLASVDNFDLQPFIWLIHPVDLSDVAIKFAAASKAIVYCEPVESVDDIESLTLGGSEVDDLISPVKILRSMIDADKDPVSFEFALKLITSPIDVPDIIIEYRDKHLIRK